MPQRPDHLSGLIADPQRASVASLLEEYSIVMLTAIYWGNEAPWEVAWRFSKDSFFLFPIVGQVRVTLDDQRLLISPGSFLMLPENVHHRMELESGHQKLQQIALHCHIHDRWRLSFLTRFSSPVGTLRNRSAGFRQLRTLVSILNGDRRAGQLYGEALLRQLLVDEVVSGHRIRPRESDADPRLERMIRFLEAEYSDPGLSVEKAAGEVNLSPVQLRKLFRRQSGLTPKEHLSKIRLQKAEHLLLQTLYSVKEIAALTGFRTDHYFHLIFRKAYGCTPSEFRRRTIV